ncbi:unnamed protein product [Closterium sp. NIES-53]
MLLVSPMSDAWKGKQLSTGHAERLSVFPSPCFRPSLRPLSLPVSTIRFPAPFSVPISVPFPGPNPAAAVAFQSSQEPPEWPVTLAAPVAFVSQQSLNSPEVAVMGRRRRLQEERGGSNPEDDEDERRQEEEEKMEEEEERKVEEEEKEEAEEEKREEEEEQRGKGGEGREGRGEEEAGEVGDKGKGEEEEQDEEGVLGDGEGEEEQEEGEGEEQKEGEGKEGEEEEEEEEGAQGKGETERSNEGSGDSSGGGASGGVGSNAGGTAAGVGGGRSDSDQSSAFGGAGGVGGGNNDGAGMGGGGMEGGKTGEGGGETGGGGGQTGGFEGGRRPGGRRYVPPLDAVIANVTGGRDRPIVVVTARAVNLEFVHNWYLSVRGKRMGRRVLFIAEDYHSFRLLNRQFPMQAALIVTPKGDQDPDMVWLQLPFGYFNGDFDLWAASSAATFDTPQQPTDDAAAPTTNHHLLRPTPLPPNQPLSTALLYFRASPGARALVQAWQAELKFIVMKTRKLGVPMNQSEGAFNRAVRGVGSAARVALLPQLLFPSTALYFSDPAFRSDLEVRSIRPVVLHSSAIENRLEKKSLLKSHGLWVLSDKWQPFAMGRSQNFGG